MTCEELKRIAASVGERQGWDFSRVRDARDPVPWDYVKVVRHYLRPSDRVLDVGTGGGERFLSLAPHFGTGIGVDVSEEMIETALENGSALAANNVSFEVMSGETLRLPDAEFDVVLNRHCSVYVEEYYRVLRTGGYFITQQVGARNAHNICTLFGCGPGGEYDWNSAEEEIGRLAATFKRLGCRVICTAEYDVGYWFLDIESLIFWHKAVAIPEDFDIQAHWQQVDQIITEYSTPKGIETNEHRELLIVQKQ
jgi:SAM-dependent methyltransferase